jgi:hypothetical protein
VLLRVSTDEPINSRYGVSVLDLVLGARYLALAISAYLSRERHE